MLLFLLVSKLNGWKCPGYHKVNIDKENNGYIVFKWNTTDQLGMGWWWGGGGILWLPLPPKAFGHIEWMFLLLRYLLHAVSWAQSYRMKDGFRILTSVWDPNPDQKHPHVFGPPGSVSQRYGSGSFPFLIKMLAKLNFCKKLIFEASLLSLKKGVRSGVGSGSGSVSHRYGSVWSRSTLKCHGSPSLILAQPFVISFS